MSKRKGQEKSKKTPKKARSVKADGLPFLTLFQQNLAALAKEDCRPLSLGSVITEARLPSSWEAFLPKHTQTVVSNVDVLLHGPEGFSPNQTYELAELKKHTTGKDVGIDLLNVERCCAEVSKFITEFDEIAKGEGGAEACVQVSNSKSLVSAPRVSRRNHLLLVLQGNIDLTVNNFHPEEPSRAEKFAEPDELDLCCSSESGDEEEHACPKKEVFHLEPHTLLYLPSGSSYSITNPAKSKIVLLFHIYFFPPVNWIDLVNTTLEDAIDSLGLSEKDVKPEDEILETAKKALVTAIDLLPLTFGRFRARSALGHQHFSVPLAFRPDFDLNKALDDNGGFLKINQFLPDDIAENILQTISALKSTEWEMSTADDDVGSNDTAHSFLSSDAFPNSGAIFRIFQNLLPGTRSIFSAGRYNVGHYIDEHSDEAHQVLGEELYSRSIAVVYHLCKDWQEDYGGVFCDAVTDTKYVPEFNSCIIFRVPRRHYVSPVVQAKGRFSIFGWFLKFERRIEMDEESEENNSE